MRSLTPDARYERRTEVVRLRKSGLTYLQIGAQTGLSRTGVFDICKRYVATGPASLRDAPAGHASGAIRKLRLPQELLLRQLICDYTPDQLCMPYLLWTRSAVTRLIDSRLGLRLKARTLDSYLARWRFSPRSASIHEVSLARALWLRREFPTIAAQAVAEDAEVNWGGDAPLRGVADVAQDAGPGMAKEDEQLGLTSAVNRKGQMRWKTHVGAITAGELIEFLRRLAKSSPKKVFLMLHDLPVQKVLSVQTWLGEHVDEIEVFCQPTQCPRRVDDRLEHAATEPAG